MKRRFKEYLQSPRPSIMESGLNHREVLLLVVLGPGFLTGSLIGVLSGDLWPSIAILPVSMAVSVWIIAWIKRPTTAVRTTRGESRNE